jgi:hypothetical protein
MSARTAGSYTLQYPVEIKNRDGEVIKSITAVPLNRLSGADVRAVANASDKGKGEATAVLICRCCGLAPSEFDVLDAADVSALGELASGFLGGSPATGDK